MLGVQTGDRVLVTGGTGSLGHALTGHLLAAGASVRIFSRDEKKQYDMARAFPACQFRLGDVRDPAAVRDAVRDIDIVVHGASLKYVNLGEQQPYEYVATNIGGTVHLLDAVLARSEVRRCVGISSDKACAPINTYGMTKAVLERLTTEANVRQGSTGPTVFTTARYGNVAGTRGSVIPFWRDRLAAGLSLPVTDPAMTRFFFTLDEAVELIDRALCAPAGMVVSKRMNACTIADLAEVMADGHPIEIVGTRPGEKIHETLLTSLEMAKTKLDGDVFIYDPAATPNGTADPFTSDVAPRLDQEAIAELLVRI